MFCVLDVLYLFGLCCCCLFLEASVYYHWIFVSFAIANFLKLRLSFVYRCCYSWVSIWWLTHAQLTLITSGSFRWPCKIYKNCLSASSLRRLVTRQLIDFKINENLTAMAIDQDHMHTYLHHVSSFTSDNLVAMYSSFET